MANRGIYTYVVESASIKLCFSQRRNEQKNVIIFVKEAISSVSVAFFSKNSFVDTNTAAFNALIIGAAGAHDDADIIIFVWLFSYSIPQMVNISKWRD